MSLQGSLIEGNIANGNGDDGIEVHNTEPGSLGANSANGNHNLGINAFIDTDAVDLGGNQARNNGAAAQCTNVSCDGSGVPLFGRRVHGGSFSAMNSDVKRASVSPFYFSGTVNKVTAFLDGGGAASGSQVVRAVIYRAAGGGGPGPLVARSFQATVNAGAPGRWVGFHFPYPPKLAPGVYWLGLQSGQTGGVARFAWDPVPGSRWYNIDTYADGPSNPFGSSAIDDEQISIYASGSY